MLKRKNRIVLGCGLITLSLSSVACSATDDLQTSDNGESETSLKTVHQEIETSASSVSVALGLMTISDTKGSPSCVGTMIAPNLLLTSKHCLSASYPGKSGLLPRVRDDVHCGYGDDGVKIKNGGRFEVDGGFQGIPLSNLGIVVSSSSGTGYSVGFFIEPPSANACGSDVGLLALREAVPMTEARPAVPFMPYGMGGLVFGKHPAFTVVSQSGLMINDDIRCVGGLTSPPNQHEAVAACSGFPSDPHSFMAPFYSRKKYPDPQRARLQNTIHEVDDKEFVGQSDLCADVKNGEAIGIAYEQGSVERALKNGTPGAYGQNYAVVTGVAARPLQGSKPSCLGTIYARTDVHREFIAQVGEWVARWGGYSPPAWTGTFTGEVSAP